MTQTHLSRRYDIDWLRNLAFLILIFYHIGMYYVADWGWHIKSGETFDWLQELMILSNTWRMSLLFFISAMALSLVQQRYSGKALAVLRTKRLMIPLLCGMFIVVVPQVYIEARAQELIEPGYWSFWFEYVNPATDLLQGHHSIIGLLTWNHLWFLPYLWVYSLIVLLVAPALNRIASSKVITGAPFWLMFMVIIGVLSFIWLKLRPEFPSTHALIDDWYNHGKYFFVFVCGYVFARHQEWWQSAVRYRHGLLAFALAGYLLILADRQDQMEWLDPLYQSSESVRYIVGLVLGLNHWGWIFALIGYAGRHLNHNSKLLSYANKAILPWYMFHQTLIIVFAWWLKPLAVPIAAEFLLILFATIAGCLLGYEIVRRWRLTRILFGLKAEAAGMKIDTKKPVLQS